jgi:hypothetical protein
VAASAALLAHTLHRLAMPQGAAQLQVNATLLRATADTLADCLARDSPGLSCALASQLMAAGYSAVDGVVSYAPQHYVGVTRLWTADHQDPSYKSDVSRWAVARWGCAVACGGAACGVAGGWQEQQVAAGQLAASGTAQRQCRGPAHSSGPTCLGPPYPPPAGSSGTSSR